MYVYIYIYILHGKIVQSITAVEDHALFRKCFCQILGRLCFPSACRSLGSTSKANVHGRGQRNVASVGQRRNNQARCVSKVLVTVDEA
jgi:hypothetical protein